MDLSLESSIIEVMVGDHCNVGFVVEIIARRIVHCTRVAGLGSTVLRRHK